MLLQDQIRLQFIRKVSKCNKMKETRQKDIKNLEEARVRAEEVYRKLERKRLEEDGRMDLPSNHHIGYDNKTIAEDRLEQY